MPQQAMTPTVLRGTQAAKSYLTLPFWETDSESRVRVWVRLRGKAHARTCRVLRVTFSAPSPLQPGEMRGPISFLQLLQCCSNPAGNTAGLRGASRFCATQYKRAPFRLRHETSDLESDELIVSKIQMMSGAHPDATETSRELH